MNIKKLYVILAVVGAIVPYTFFIHFITQNGIDPIAFCEGAFANSIATALTADLLIASLVFCIATIELWRRDLGPAPWAFIIMNLVIGLAFALALYLCIRHMRQQTTDSAAA